MDDVTFWKQRVVQEQSAAMRASPINPQSQTARNTRDARLRLEIELALRAAAMRRGPPKESKDSTTSSPRKKPSSDLPPLSHRSHRSHHSSTSRRHKEKEAPVVQPLRPLAGSQVGLPVSQAGSLSSRLLKDRGVVFKNIESDSWGF